MTGLVNQELLLQVEYLAAENRILRGHAPARLRLSDAERAILGEIGKRLGRKGLVKVAQVAKPETILGWWRKLVAQKFDGSKHRSYPGRPKIDPEIQHLVVQMARENSGWGYDRIAGALANLGHNVSDQTVGNVLRRHGMLLLRNGVRLRHGRISPRIWRLSARGALRRAPASGLHRGLCGRGANPFRNQQRGSTCSASGRDVLRTSGLGIGLTAVCILPLSLPAANIPDFPQAALGNLRAGLVESSERGLIKKLF